MEKLLRKFKFELGVYRIFLFNRSKWSKSTVAKYMELEKLKNRLLLMAKDIEYNSLSDECGNDRKLFRDIEMFLENEKIPAPGKIGSTNKYYRKQVA